MASDESIPIKGTRHDETPADRENTHPQTNLPALSRIIMQCRQPGPAEHPQVKQVWNQ